MRTKKINVGDREQRKYIGAVRRTDSWADRFCRDEWLPLKKQKKKINEITG